MRILHVYKAYPPVIGGIEFHLRTVAEAQAASGHDVTALVVGDGHKSSVSVEAGVRVVRAGRLGAVSSAPFGPRLATELTRERPDITHLHAPFPPGEAAWLLLGRRPMVATHHADIVRQKLLGALWSPIQRRVLSSARRIIIGSPVLARTSPSLAEHAERLRVIPYGVDAERFAPTADRLGTAREQRASDPFFNERRVLVFVGRLRYYKGLDVLIDALASIPNVCLLVVGTGDMGPAWRARSQELGVAGRIRWLGDVSDEALPAILHMADAYVFPSSARSESFGIAMAEAMAAGLPIVSTELGTGTSWVNEHGVTGLVAPPRNPEGLAEAIRQLLDSPRLREKMGRSARQRAVETFSVSSMMLAIESTYAEALQA